MTFPGCSVVAESPASAWVNPHFGTTNVRQSSFRCTHNLITHNFEWSGKIRVPETGDSSMLKAKISRAKF
jgi:hypothetical protein